MAQRESALQQATKFHAKAALSGSGVYGDTIKGGPGVDLIFGGANSDTIDKLGGFTDIVFGNEGNDSIKSSASFAVLVGGEGNDNLVANSPGGSLLLGDTFTWLGTSLRPQISLDWSDTTLAKLTLAAGLVATGEGKDRLSAMGKYNVLFGGGGNDTIKGGSTFNFMVGDSISLGFDFTIDYKDALDAALAGDSLLAAITKKFRLPGLTGSGNDTIQGGAGIDVVLGGDGKDTIKGGAGIVDILLGNKGDDTIKGEAGFNVVVGGEDNDKVTGGNDGNLLLGETFNFARGIMLDIKELKKKKLVITQGITSYGSGADEITGGSGFDFIVGGNGDDDIEAGDGFNVAFGDAFNIGSAFTWSFGSLFSDVADVLSDPKPALTTFDGFGMTGNGNDYYLGGDHTDVAFGGAGNDELYGEADNDKLYGGTGTDSLYASTGTNQLFPNNVAPFVANLGAAISYRENSAPIPISTTATVSDADSFDFSGGNLTVKFPVGAQASDRLSIRTAGGISTSDKAARYAGTTIGVFNGGDGTTPLVVKLYSQATPAIVQALLRNIVYRNASENPSNVGRTISVQLNDGDGSASAAVTRQIRVIPVNDKPVLAGISGTVNYVHNTTAIVLASTATVSDVDSGNFYGGVLRVWFTAGVSSSNRLGIGGSFTIDSSNNVKLGNAVIGTLTSNGQGTKELTVRFKSTATKAIVQQLVRAITCKTDKGLAGLRKIGFSVSDGDGGLSTELIKSVKVN